MNWHSVTIRNSLHRFFAYFVLKLINNKTFLCLFTVMLNSMIYDYIFQDISCETKFSFNRMQQLCTNLLYVILLNSFPSKQFYASLNIATGMRYVILHEVQP